MKLKGLIFVFGSIIAIVSCNRYDIEAFEEDIKKQDAKETAAHAEKIFGTIDPNQDWNSIKNGLVTVTADACLNNISKVQILTESPFLNPNAHILAEADVNKGQRVTLIYDAPNTYDRLIAACIDNEGHYYIKGFNTSESVVNFNNSSTTRAARRAGETYPDVSYIKLEYKNSILSFNAQRTIYANDEANKQAATKANIIQWAGSGWENERLWKPTDKYNTSTTWEVRNQTVVRVTDELTSEEEQMLKDIFGRYLERDDASETWGRKDNRKYIVEKMRESDAISFYNNQLTSDGSTPITITPIFMASSEIGNCHLYYYYYNPNAIPSEMTEAQYIKTLPKFKAIQCWHTRAAANGKGKGLTDLFKAHEYLLPYYGNDLGTSQNAISLAIPKGYRIGFMLRKLPNNDIKNCKNGCSYGFGKLNNEINQLPGHFASGNLYFSMELDDSRVCMFNANGKTYLGFEDGSDCNYNDMIIEIGGYDTEVLSEVPANTANKSSGILTDYLDFDDAPETEAYTMCFEDRPNQADYDMNDVVLRCTRVDKTTLSLALVATGANDDVVIHGATGWPYNDQEVHKLFHATDPNEQGNRFVNTVVGGTHREVMAQYVDVEEGMTIPDYMKGIYIENKTTGKTIHISQKGEPPFSIIVPEDFQYPMEQTPITGAYSTFIKWAQNVNDSKDWYLYEEANKIFPSLFKKW